MQTIFEFIGWLATQFFSSFVSQNENSQMNQTQNDVHGVSSYTIGMSISLLPRSRGMNDPLTVLIVKPIHIGHGRSQTVIVRVSESSDDSKRNGIFFAKFFDPSYYTPEKGEFNGSGKEYMNWQLTNEVKSYERMKNLHGISVPRFFGHYQYIKGDGEYVDLILLECISVLSLDTIHDLTTNEIESLRTQCMDVLNQIHACGVVHNDIAGRNIFWSQYEGRVIICDFALAATFDDFSSDEEGARVLDCKERDKTFMHFVVNDTGKLKNGVSQLSENNHLWN